MASEQQNDTHMADVSDAQAAPPASSDPVGPLLLSDKEKQILALYDQLRGTQLQVALLTARQAYTGDNQSDGNVAAAQKRLLEARAAYVLRNKVVDSVLTVYPVLRAVHGATLASPIERDLLPVVEQRDAASQAVARAAAAQRAVLDEHAAVAAERWRLERQNAQLAAQLRALVAAQEAAEREADDAAGGGGDGDGSADDGHKAAADALAQAKADDKTSRQRWRLIKGATSAIIAGSGVDWARDATLHDLVLDPE